MRSRTLLVAALLTLAGCSSSPGAGPKATPVPSPTPSPRLVINPPGVVVSNEAFGASEKKVRASMAVTMRNSDGSTTTITKPVTVSAASLRL